MRIVQLSAQHIVSGDTGEVCLETETVKHVGNSTERHPTIAAFNGAQRRTRHAGALGHQSSREVATLACELDVLAQGNQDTADRWQ